MSERYSRIFSLSENLYTEGSPVIIKAGALLKDNDTSWLIAQLKLQNISNKAIKLVKVEINCFDSVGRATGESVLYEYLDLHAARGTDFGTQNPIKISNSSTRSYTVRIVEVGFTDNDVWNGADKTFESMRQQGSINVKIADEDMLKVYQKTFGNNAIYDFCTHKDLWLCTCGETNHSNETRCYKCNAEFERLNNLDWSALENEAIKNKEEDKIKNKKRNKIIHISLIMLVAFIVASVIGYVAIYPAISFANGDYRVYIDMYDVKEFEVPNGVTTIDDSMFYCCYSLTSIVIPDSVTSIGYGAFHDCYSLASVVIGDSVTSISEKAFAGCSSLTSVVIGDSVTLINEAAFNGCSSLTSVVIPDGVTSIGYAAFAYCDNLASIVIPDSVTSIGDGAFWSCSNLKDIYYTGSEAEWEMITILSDNGLLTRAEKHYSYVPEN